MAKLYSDAGEMQVAITKIECEEDALVFIGQMGVWKSRVVVPSDELWAMMPGVPKAGAIRLLLRAAWRSITHRNRRKS